jgi:prolyl oligopeptidase
LSELYADLQIKPTGWYRKGNIFTHAQKPFCLQEFLPIHRFMYIRIKSIAMKTLKQISLILCIFTGLAVEAQNNPTVKYPMTRKEKVTDTYFGNTIADPYRWLENDTATEVKAWVTAQNEVTQNYLSKIPYREKIRQRLTDLFNYERFGAPWRIGDKYLFSRNDGLQNQSVYYVQTGLNGEPSVFIDPNKMSSDGTAAISLMGDSRDHQFMAYAINQSGSDWQTIRVRKMADATDTNDELNWVKFSGAAWKGNGFYYSRYAQPEKGLEFSGKNENHQVWYHELGTTQSKDVLVYEDKNYPLRYYIAQTSEDERFLYIYISQGTHGTEILFKDLTQKDSQFKTLFKGFENQFAIVDNIGSKVIVSTDYKAPNYRVITVDLAAFNPEKPLDEQLNVLVPEQKYLLETVSSAGGKLFLNYLKDVNSLVEVYSYEGKKENTVQLPALGTAAGFGGRKEDTEVFFTFTSFTYPSTIYRYTLADQKTELFRKSSVKFNPEEYITEQKFFTSKDGTKVPMFIVYKKGLVKNGKNPTLVYGYGGFNVNLTPSFSVSRLVLLENGGIFAMVNLRGGGEYGEDWHKAGMLDKKQNVFDDFIAAAEYLQKEKYTSPEYTAVQGGSNGGLLIGAVINQRPELYKVAFPAVGVMDMLRYHKFTIGWGWAVEYGSSDSLEQYNYLIKYSPVHNISKKSYPATMITTADHDDRVVPAHSFKYAATLQANQQGANPTLIRIDVKAGHGAGKPLSKTIDEITDMYAFMFQNMDWKVKY